MSNAVAVAARLVKSEQTRLGSKMLAYQSVASRVGRSSDWLRRLLRDGSSVVTDQIKDRFDAMLIRRLEADFARLRAELDLARQSGAHPLSRRVAEIEAHVAAIERLLKEGA